MSRISDRVSDKGQGKMKKVYEKAVIEDYLKKSGLQGQFHVEGLNFFGISYQAGELISTPEYPVAYFQFLVKGSVTLYYLEEDGSRRNVIVMEGEGLLGDMEFALGNAPMFYAEAVTAATVLALPLEENRAKLEKDCDFLMYLLRNACRIKVLSARNRVVLPRLEERLLYYMETECAHQAFTGMDGTAAKLQCSRRQLQRVVKKLEEQGVLVKRGKGRYQLNRCP